MNENPIDLPSRNITTLPTMRVERMPAKESQLSQRQVDVLVNSSTKALDGAIKIANGVLEIGKIRAQSQADVDVIEAKMLALQKQVRGEIDLLTAQRETTRARGDVAVALINKILPAIPEEDRYRSLKLLRKIINDVLTGQGGHEHQQS